MKKLILFIVALVFISQARTQYYEIYYQGQLLPKNGEITITSNPDSGMMALDALDVKNISNVTSEVFCLRTLVENVEGTVNSFCWESCNPSAADTSSVSVTILPKKTSYVFSGEHHPNGNPGVVKIKYTFYDSQNANNQATVFVNYDATFAVINTEPAGVYTLSEAYPNPASNWVGFDYQITGMENGSIVIYNLLGTPMDKVDLSGKTGKIRINTSLYNEGIYFYSLLIDNKVVRTQKLIVRH